MMPNGHSRKRIPDTNGPKSNSKEIMQIFDSDYAGTWESVGSDTLTMKNSADTFCKPIFATSAHIHQKLVQLLSYSLIRRARKL